jgi:hypothetical protein
MKQFFFARELLVASVSRCAVIQSQVLVSCTKSDYSVGREHCALQLASECFGALSRET